MKLSNRAHKKIGNSLRQMHKLGLFWRGIGFQAAVRITHSFLESIFTYELPFLNTTQVLSTQRRIAKIVANYWGFRKTPNINIMLDCFKMETIKHRAGKASARLQRK